LNPFFFVTYARSLFAARRYSEAIEKAKRVAALNSNRGADDVMVVASIALGKAEAARAYLGGIQPEQLRLAWTAIVEARAGNRAASDAALSLLRKRDNNSIDFHLATVYAQRGETGAAIDALEAALRHKDFYLSRVAIDPFLDPLRKEPRFKAVQDAVIPPDLFVPPKRG
jgi:tetratricopeptide (TPR) repeat protein